MRQSIQYSQDELILYFRDVIKIVREDGNGDCFQEGKEIFDAIFQGSQSQFSREKENWLFRIAAAL